MVGLTKPTVTLGIYEKALISNPDWDAWFASVAQGGFSFTDLSIDESSQRLARLDWDKTQREKVRQAAVRAGVQIGGVCLSAHRGIMPGSSDPAMRKQARELYYRGIDFCLDLGIPVLQVAGYYAYYEQDREDYDQQVAREYYLEALAQALPYAAQCGVTLAIENVDGHDLAAIPQVMQVLEELPSPWLQVYPDIGNIAEHGGDATQELRAGEGHMVALHVKDVLPGQPRRIPLGEGCADFPAAFTELARQRWSGRIMLEMWNDDAPDSVERCIAARQKLEGLLAAAGITIAAEKGEHSYAIA